jgi:hypothetical protein
MERCEPFHALSVQIAFSEPLIRKKISSLISKQFEPGTPLFQGRSFKREAIDDSLPGNINERLEDALFDSCRTQVKCKTMEDTDGLI